MKISPDQLVNVGRYLSTHPAPRVDTVDFEGETISARVALDAFEQAQKAAAEPPGKIGQVFQNTVHKVEQEGAKTEAKLMSSSIGRYVAEHVKPVEPLVQHEPITLHYYDLTSKDVDLPMVDTQYNRMLHNIEIGVGVSAFVPGLGMASYAGAAVGTAIAAGEAKVSGQSDKAQNLWQATKTNLFRAVATLPPLAGHVVNAYIIAQEARARDALTHPASVGQVTGAAA